MSFSKMLEILKMKEKNKIVLVKCGAFYIGTAEDAVLLHHKLNLKCTCFQNNVCKVGIPVMALEKYIAELNKLKYSYAIYDFEKEKRELAKIYRQLLAVFYMSNEPISTKQKFTDYRTMHNRIDKIIEFSELGTYIDNPVRTYSSGMYMRLAFAVAINVDAEILLVDEVLAVGDQHFQDKCIAKMKELREQGITMVFVTHSLGTVKEFCNRAIWLNNGEIVMDDEPNKVIERYLAEMG